MPKSIPLTQGYEAIVDDEDYERLSRHKWCVCGGYAIRKKWMGSGVPLKNYWMHREIAHPQDGTEVDHINGNKLDNRKCNLRVVTHHQNAMNRSKHKNGKSIYRGVCKHGDNRWKAYLKHNGKQTYLGLFDNEIDAALAFNDAAKKIYGEFARLNEVCNA